MTTLPITLHGNLIRLEPLCMDHHAGLCKAVADGELWNLTVTLIPAPADMALWLDEALSAWAEGRELPFAIVWNETGEVVGTTRICSIDREHRRAEIGRTWVALRWQRTPVNTEAKFLLLRHAFEHMQCLRVEFITDVLNEASQNALARVGAKVEGILRNHMIMRGGRCRDSYILSIICSEWPVVKANLLHLLHCRPEDSAGAA